MKDHTNGYPVVDLSLEGIAKMQYGEELTILNSKMDRIISDLRAQRDSTESILSTLQLIKDLTSSSAKVKEVVDSGFEPMILKQEETNKLIQKNIIAMRSKTSKINKEYKRWKKENLLSKNPKKVSTGSTTPSVSWPKTWVASLCSWLNW